MSWKVKDGDWYEAPEGLILVEKVLKGALVCVRYSSGMRIEQVVRMDDELVGWLLIGRRDHKKEVTRWCDPTPLPDRTAEDR